MPTSKNTNNLVINKVESQTVYDYMKNNSLINDDELYLINGNGSVDASSIDGLDTYLTSSYYPLKMTYGSYVGENLRNNCESVDALINTGRQIQLPFEPVKIHIGDAVLRQNDYATYGQIILLSGGGFKRVEYYTACLKGSILYVASATYYLGHDVNGFNSNGTYYWEIIK